MDETDKPNRSFDLGDLQDDLHDQLQEAIERSKQPTVNEEWTPEDQADLNAEMARIPFNPKHANPDFADRTVVIDDEEVQVHFYNNFPMLMTILDTLRNSDEQSNLGLFEAAYAAVSQERRYFEIFDALEKSFPALLKRTKQLFANRGESTKLGSREVTADERAYIYSQAYGAAADIARGLDPGYNLAYLYG
jgi:hypothetical protein